jgi:hypothetical protein
VACSSCRLLLLLLLLLLPLRRALSLWRRAPHPPQLLRRQLLFRLLLLSRLLLLLLLLLLPLPRGAAALRRRVPHPLLLLLLPAAERLLLPTLPSVLCLLQTPRPHVRPRLAAWRAVPLPERWRARASRGRARLRMRGVAGRGQLCHLNLSQQHVTRAVLLPLLTANASSLRELHLHRVRAQRIVLPDDTDCPVVEEVVATAPLLQVLTAEDVSCMWDAAPRMLRAAPPFAPLQMRGNFLVYSNDVGLLGGLEHVGPIADALADAALQPALSHLRVQVADTTQPAVMGALADAAVARQLHELSLKFCTQPAAALLARLLAQGSLTALEIGPPGGDALTSMFEAAGAALVAGALRVNATLTKLVLFEAGLCEDMHVAESLLGALVGHPSLRELRVTCEPAVDSSAFGAALAALIAADAPALHVLVCSDNHAFGDVGLAPIVEALARNRHLRELHCGHSCMSETFARERLLPAVRANTSLRMLTCADRTSGPAAVEAEELVRRRWQHG